MKTANTCNVLFKTLLLAQLFVLFSCSGDPVEDDPVVKTLVSEIEGNDGVSVDRKGNIYVSNFGAFENGQGSGTKIIKVSPNGETQDYATGLEGPLGNVVDVFGNLYFIHANNPTSGTGKVMKVSRSGEKTMLAEIEGFPSGITIDHYSNTAYVANFSTPTIHKITSNGTVSIFATDDRLAGCVGIDIARNGNIITANFNTAEILSIDRDGTVSSIVTIPDATIVGYMTILKDNIYATTLAENKIFKITMDGTVTTFAGNGEVAQKDGSLLEASFNVPNGIASDKRKNILYISEFGTPGGLRKIQL